MRVNPGELNKSIEIIAKVEGERDEEGFEIADKAEVIRKCKAKVSRRSGTQVAEANGEVNVQNVRFLVRFSRKNPINEDMQIVYGGKTYDIEYINDYDDAHEYVEIWATLKEMT